MTPLQRSLFFRGALLFFLGLLTGVWAGAVLTEGRAIFMHFQSPPDGKLVLVAHLNALLGCFWIVAVSLTLEATSFGDRGKTWLGRGVTLVNYANWSVTLLASFFREKGLEMIEGNAKNNVVAFLLIALVVLPGLAVAGAWAWGLLPRGAEKAA
ncbi:MAG TPA: hypothetical protein VFF73_22765 [Planctomycetota bacterium]|nr:hypothetical protein [Planctomycetota bacterium]